MPPRKRATGKAKSAKPAKSLEQRLWEAADKMRGNLEPAEQPSTAAASRLLNDPG